MPEREQVENLLADLRRRRQEAEAEAGHAAERLARLVSGMTPLAEADAAQVRATADTFADAAERLKAMEQFARELRGLLM
jgi:cytochrome c556